MVSSISMYNDLKKIREEKMEGIKCYAKTNDKK